MLSGGVDEGDGLSVGVDEGDGLSGGVGEEGVGVHLRLLHDCVQHFQSASQREFTLRHSNFLGAELGGVGVTGIGGKAGAPVLGVASVAAPGELGTGDAIGLGLVPGEEPSRFSDELEFASCGLCVSSWPLEGLVNNM